MDVVMDVSVSTATRSFLTRRADDAGHVLGAAGARNVVAEAVDLTLGQVGLIAVAVHASDRHRQVVGAEESRLQRVLRVRQAELTTHDHRVENAPAAAANEAPVAVVVADEGLDAALELVAAAREPHLDAVDGERLAKMIESACYREQ